jgi:polyferredoxin
MRRFRTAFQLVVVAATIAAGVRFAMGGSLTSVEKYCPFGGLETAYAFFTRQKFTCAAGELNLSLFLALLGLTLIARKAFCGWACPLGAVLEWTGRLGRTLFGRRSFQGVWQPPLNGQRALQVVLRTVVLGVILAATWTTGELVFRGYDPFYILFSVHGHDVRTWSYAILGGVLVLGVLFPLSWCKYLCPLGTALWPFSAAGRLRLERSEAVCTGCGACDRACPQALAVAGVPAVRSGECTLCLECTEACPVPGALELRLKGAGR